MLPARPPRPSNTKNTLVGGVRGVEGEACPSSALVLALVLYIGITARVYQINPAQTTGMWTELLSYLLLFPPPTPPARATWLHTQTQTATAATPRQGSKREASALSPATAARNKKAKADVDGADHASSSPHELPSDPVAA